MKKRRAVYLSLLLAVVLPGFARGQDGPVTNLLSRLEKFRKDFPQEKVHLHLDRSFYSIGDTIWFQSYVVNAEDGLPSKNSRVVYVDLINERDSVRQSLKIPVNGGLAPGDFVLSDSLREGNYRIRAYTSWMRNFDEDFFYDRSIWIGNALTNQVLASANYTFQKSGNRENVEATLSYADFAGLPLSGRQVTYEVELDARLIARGSGMTDAGGQLKVPFVNNQPFILKSGHISTMLSIGEKQQVVKIFPVKSTLSATDVRFFPEGGRLVDGLRSRVAFKASGADGSSISVSGYVADQAGIKMASLETEHAGMGAFYITPLPGSEYTAHIIADNGSEQLIKLPAAETNGYSLGITAADTAFNVRIAVSPLLKSGGDLMLIGQCRQQVTYNVKIPVDRAEISLKLPKAELLPGIIHFTLFDPAGRPVAERLGFTRGVSPQVSLKMARQTGTGEKTALEIAVLNKSGHPSKGNFSIAVTNFSKSPADENGDPSILSDLLLSSDIKGYIEDPNYYFNAPGALKDHHLDLLLLTQGWSKFTWIDLQAGKTPLISFPFEDGISISGQVVDKNERPASGGKVTLLSTSGTVLALDTITGQDGTFRFDRLVFADKTAFVLQARNSKGQKNVSIELDRTPAQAVTKNRNFPALFAGQPTQQLPYLLARRDEFDEMRKNGTIRKSILLSEVKLTAPKESLKNSSNLNGPGNADYVIKSDRLTGYRSLVQALEGKIAGVAFQNGVAYLARNLTGMSASPMYIVVDGMSSSPGALSSISVSDVDYVEILKSAGNTAIYGINGGAGVIIVTTKRGERTPNYPSLAAGMATISPKGYYTAREFHSPGPGQPGVSRQPADTRTTIYWNPKIALNDDGKTQLEFYNAGAPGTYRAVLEGIGDDGTPVRKVIHFIVN